MVILRSRLGVTAPSPSAPASVGLAARVSARWVVFVALLIEDFRDFNAGDDPYVSTVKALFIHTARDLETGAAGLGILCFFDGLANSMVVGRVSRDLADRSGAARVKLAYIADSTSSAVACVAFVSTWIAFQLTMISEAFVQAGRPANPYGIFLESLPYNFYCWFTLVLLFGVTASAAMRMPGRGLWYYPAAFVWSAVAPLVAYGLLEVSRRRFRKLMERLSGN